MDDNQVTLRWFVRRVARSHDEPGGYTYVEKERVLQQQVFYTYHNLASDRFEQRAEWRDVPTVKEQQPYSERAGHDGEPT